MLQNGWVKFHRKLLDNDLLMHDQSAYVLFTRLLLVVDSKTGTYKTGRYMLAELTGLKPSTVYKTLKRLEKESMIALSSNNKMTAINILNWRQYQSDGNNKVTTKEQQSNTKQEIINKNNSSIEELAKPKTMSVDINEMFEYWQAATGVEIASRAKANRFAASNLLKKHGSEKLKRLIDGVAMSRSDEYAPRIADFTQLQAKLSDLLVWGTKKGQKQAKGQVLEL